MGAKFVEVYPQACSVYPQPCGNPYLPHGDRVSVEEVKMNKSFRLEMAQQLLATLAEAERTHGRTATTALRATVARFVADLLA